MLRHQCQIPSRLKVVAWVTLVVTTLALHDYASAEVNLSVGATAGYTSNLLRVPDGEDDFPVALGVTGTWIETTRHLSADVEGAVHAIKYVEGRFEDDEVLGRLDGSVIWWAVPEEVAWVLENVYGQVTIDPFSPIGPANRQNTNFLSTGPDWYIPIGERTRVYLGGRFGSAWYENTEDDSERLLGIVGIDRAVTSSTRLGVEGSTESVDYESAVQPDFDRSEAYVRYEYTRDEEYGLTVNAGCTWQSSDADDRSAPLLEVLLSRPLSTNVDLQLEFFSRFSDAGVDFAAGGLPGSVLGTDPGVISSGGPFEVRGGRGVIEFEQPRTTLGFAVGVADEMYETVTLDRQRLDARLSAERRMTPRMTGLASVQWTKSEYESDGQDREDTDSEYRLELRRELGRHSSLSVVGLYASRSSDDPLNEYDEIRSYVTFDYSLR